VRSERPREAARAVKAAGRTKGKPVNTKMPRMGAYSTESLDTTPKMALPAVNS
jgi:hypothetical protein